VALNFVSRSAPHERRTPHRDRSGRCHATCPLRGIVPALITPLDEAGRVDEASVHSLVDFQVGAGVHGLLILGSTGEGPLLPADEKVRLVRTSGGSLTAAAIGSFKLALCDMGVLHSATVSQPLQPLSDDERKRVRDIVARLDIQRPAVHA
jgi:dihydrodipicolinate synthase/N-acetylneuraminate lyase